MDVAFSPDGATLALSGLRVVLWDLSVASWERRACAIVNRNLSRAEWSELIGGRYERLC